MCNLKKICLWKKFWGSGNKHAQTGVYFLAKVTDYSLATYSSSLIYSTYVLKMFGNIANTYSLLFRTLKPPVPSLVPLGKRF